MVIAVAVCVTVQITAADAMLAAVDAGSDAEASDEDQREWHNVDHSEQYINESTFKQICNSTNRQSY